MVASGTLKQILRNKNSVTGLELGRQRDGGQALGQARSTNPPLAKRGGKNKTPSLVFKNLRKNNLKTFPWPSRLAGLSPSAVSAVPAKARW